MSAGDILLRLAVAAAAGMLIGFERERLEKAAGLRTLALVSTGSAIFVLGAILLAPFEGARMAAGIATGVGFLGAGAILRDRGEVVGLTTAATVWIAAALGIASAVGAYTLTAIGAGLTLFVLTVLGLIDFTRLQLDARTYEVTFAGPDWDEAASELSLTGAGLRLSLLSVAWTGERVTVSWRALGRRPAHDRGLQLLRESPSVASFTVHS